MTEPTTFYEVTITGMFGADTVTIKVFDNQDQALDFAKNLAVHDLEGPLQLWKCTSPPPEYQVTTDPSPYKLIAEWVPTHYNE